MKPMFVLAFAMLVLLSACSDAADDSGVNPAGEAGTETTPSPGADADLATVQDYELTMEGIDKYYEAMKNVSIAMNELSPEERERQEAAMDGDESANIDEFAEHIAQNPLYSEALDDAGISAQEFAVLTMSLLQSGMAAAVIEMQPNADPDSLVREMQANPKNVAFIRENRHALDARQQAMEAELESMGISVEE